MLTLRCRIEIADVWKNVTNLSEAFSALISNNFGNFFRFYFPIA